MSTSIPPVNGAIAPVMAPALPSGADADAFERCFAAAAAETSAPDQRDDRAEAERGGDTASAGPNDAPPKDRPSDTLVRDVDRHTGGSGHRGGARDDDAPLPPLLSAHALVAPWLAPPIASTLVPAAAPEARSGWAQISAHVERLLIASGPQGPDGRAAAMFTVSGELLTDTSVSLTRTGTGWLLRIQTSDPLLLADSKRHEAALRKRFADRGLGGLIVEQV
jgi:hypothetical protein